MLKKLFNLPTKIRYIIALVFVSVFAYWFWPVDIAKHLESKLTEICEKLSFEKQYPFIEARIKAKESISILSKNVYVHYQSPDFEFSKSVKKQEIMDQISAGLIHFHNGKVGFSRFKIMSSEPNLVKASLFVIAEWRESPEGEVLQAAEDVRLEFEKIEGDWLITKIETLPRITL